jgi:hypothetical protein
MLLPTRENPDNKEHIREYITARIAAGPLDGSYEWSTPGVKEPLIALGLECCAMHRVERPSLSTVRDRLEALLSLLPRPVLYDAVGPNRQAISKGYGMLKLHAVQRCPYGAALEGSNSIPKYNIVRFITLPLSHWQRQAG